MSDRVNIGTVEGIIQDYLKANGFGGLFNGNDGNGCGCGIENLAPCECDLIKCRPAWRRPATQEDVDAGIECEVGGMISTIIRPA
jgi:hypothetical protein